MSSISGALGLDSEEKKRKGLMKIAKMKVKLRRSRLVFDKNLREFHLLVINLRDATENLNEFANTKTTALDNWVDSLHLAR